MRHTRSRAVRAAATTATLAAVLAVAVLGAAPAMADGPPSSGSASSSNHPDKPDSKGESRHGTLVPLPDPPWPPPKVDMGLNKAPAKPAPDHDYQPATKCITSGVLGDVLKSKPWAQPALQIRQVHKLADGAGRTIGIIDTGVHKNKFFQNRLTPGGDYVSDDADGLKDCDGHGTEVAGIIAANTHANPRNDIIGFDGVAPKATVVSARTTSENWTYQPKDSDQKIHAGNLYTLGLAINHLVAKFPKLDAINISLTACIPVTKQVNSSYRFLQAAIHHAVKDKNVVVVAAAGNTSKNASKGCSGNNTIPSPKYIKMVPIPAWFGHDVLTVAAMNQKGDPAGFSVHGPWVDVAAPGTDIVSLDPAGDAIVNRSVQNVGSINGGGGDSASASQKQAPMPIQGTSFAAPYVTGLVSLVRETHPWLNAYQVMHRIKMTAQHPSSESGRNNAVGYGMINPMAALTDIVPGEPGKDGAPGAPVAHATRLPAALPPPDTRNWTAAIVALAGTGGGIAALLITLFVVHTNRRNRRRRSGGTA